MNPSPRSLGEGGGFPSLLIRIPLSWRFPPGSLSFCFTSCPTSQVSWPRAAPQSLPCSTPEAAASSASQGGDQGGDIRGGMCPLLPPSCSQSPRADREVEAPDWEVTHSAPGHDSGQGQEENLGILAPRTPCSNPIRPSPLPELGRTQASIPPAPLLQLHQAPITPLSLWGGSWGRTLQVSTGLWVQGTWGLWRLSAGSHRPSRACVPALPHMWSLLVCLHGHVCLCPASCPCVSWFWEGNSKGQVNLCPGLAGVSFPICVSCMCNRFFFMLVCVTV